MEKSEKNRVIVQKEESPINLTEIDQEDTESLMGGIKDFFSGVFWLLQLIFWVVYIFVHPLYIFLTIIILLLIF